MKITYHSDLDVLRIVFRAGAIAESDEMSPDMIFDFDDQGNVMGLEVLSASHHLDTPWGIIYEVIPKPSPSKESQLYEPTLIETWDALDQEQ